MNVAQAVVLDTARHGMLAGLRLKPANRVHLRYGVGRLFCGREQGFREADSGHQNVGTCDVGTHPIALGRWGAFAMGGG